VSLRKVPFLLFLVPAALFADEVFLQGAGSISGRIVEQTDEIVQVDVGGGIVGVPTSRVERIVKARCSLDDYDDRASKLGPKDAGGWRKLGVWASQQGLTVQSQDAYRNVLAVAPDDAEARKALGFVKHDGRWMTEEESYRARGYVKYEGEWMTPAQAQVEQNNAAADQARRDAEQRARDAETATREAEARAQDAEARAREAEEAQRASAPVYWGGWGYGVAAWPSAPASQPKFTPAPRVPVRVPR